MPQTYYQIKADVGTYWSLPVTNPFYLASMISFCSTVVVTPVCYAVIYK